VINSAVRGVVVAALSSALALVPAAAAHADKDKEIEKVELLGFKVADTRPGYVEKGDAWVTRLDLYTPKKHKKQRLLQYAGDGQSRCNAIGVHGDKVTALCTRVLRLKQGTLTLSDMITYESHKPVTAKTGIISGTGRYRSAYGDGYITQGGPYVHFELNVDE
jgi:hypothetical protein